MPCEEGKVKKAAVKKAAVKKVPVKKVPVKKAAVKKAAVKKAAVKKVPVRKAAVKPSKEEKSEKQVSHYSDIERKGYAFSLYTVLVLDALKKELKENAQDSDWIVENVFPDLDRVLDQAFRFQIKMLIEDPGSGFFDGLDE
jgi:hypothetical protein